MATHTCIYTPFRSGFFLEMAKLTFQTFSHITELHCQKRFGNFAGKDAKSQMLVWLTASSYMTKDSAPSSYMTKYLRISSYYASQANKMQSIVMLSIPLFSHIFFAKYSSIEEMQTGQNYAKNDCFYFIFQKHLLGIKC